MGGPQSQKTGIDTEQLKNIQVDMLKCFIAVCQKHNLRYFLLGGSALGAVRHKGYIPWDDDIDVGLPRNDYEKFLEVAQKDLPENIFVQTTITDPEYPVNFAKLRNSDTTFVEKSVKNFNINHGVYIDIFPLDGYKKSSFSELLYKIYTFRIGCEFYSDDKNSGFKNKFLKIVLPIVFPNYKKLKYKNEKYMKKRNYDESELIRNFCGAWGLKEVVPKSFFGNGAKAEFEGFEVIIPEQYDLYLTSLYGDYMKLPPVEKRVPHHYCEIVDLSSSYKNYI